MRYGESESCASLPRWSRARSPCRPASPPPFAGRQAWIPHTALNTEDVRRPAAKVMATATNVADGPDYIAFRIPEGRGLLTVVAAVQPGAGATFPWAVWYSALAPTGEFKKAPLNYIRFGIGARIAKSMIEVIKSGASLPADLVEQLLVVKL